MYDVERRVLSCIMPCAGRGSLPTLSLRGLLKRIRCHVALCQGVVTVIKVPDGPQEENDMEDGKRGSTHSTQNVSQPRSSRWFLWCQALGRCRTRQRRETVYHAKLVRISTGVYTSKTCQETF